MVESNKTDEPSRGFLARLSAMFSGAAFGAFFGAAGTIIVAATGFMNKDRELDIEMVKISLSILAGENKDTSIPGWRFALRALEEYSRVDIPDSEFELWVQKGTIPDIRLRPNCKVFNGQLICSSD